MTLAAATVFGAVSAEAAIIANALSLNALSLNALAFGATPSLRIVGVELPGLNR